MKICMLTYQLGKDWTLDEIIQVSNKLKLDGVEFRAEAGHKHGVELETSADERSEIKKKMADAGLITAGLGTSVRFEYPEPEERKKQVEHTKEFVQLAKDIGAERVRVFGNCFPPGRPKEDLVGWITEGLLEISEFAADHAVEVDLEMHGDLWYWEPCVKIMENVDKTFIGLVENCDPREVVGGSVKPSYERVAPYIRHVHMHNLEDVRFPYRELFEMLYLDDYQGFLSMEASGSSDPERIVALYKLYLDEVIANIAAL